MIPILFTAEAEPEALLDVNSVPLQDVNGVELLASGDPTVARLFNTHGLGVLTDCISCEVTEERNGEYELVLEYPSNGVHYDEIALRRIILVKPNASDGLQAFRIYFISAEIDGMKTVNARHLIYDLSGVPVLPFTAQNAAAACAGLINNAAFESPFEITTQVGTIADFKVDVPSSVRSWFGGKEGSLIDIYGGEWHYDNYTAMLDDARGQDRGVVIRYGVNLIDFQQEKNCEEVWTGVLPYWANEEGTVVRANIINLEGSFDFRRILCLDLSQDFEEQPTTAQLIARAQTYITANNIGVPRVSLSLDWAQSTEVVELCDTVTVEFERLGISTKAKCVRTVWDVLKERYTRIEIGDARTNITDTISQMQVEEEKQKSSVSASMLRAIANATALITGNEGGYFIVHDSNGDGYPDETLWMDTSDIETATRVWRFNQAGLGFSSSGYDGPYGLAITMNGEIVANFITTGTLSAVDIDGVNITGSTITGNDISGGTINGTEININKGDTRGHLNIYDTNGTTLKGWWSNNALQCIDQPMNVVSNTLGTLQGLACYEYNGSGGARKDYASFTQSSAVVRNLDSAGSTSFYQERMISNDIEVARYVNNALSTRSYMTATSMYTSGSLTQGSDIRKKDILDKDIPDLSGIRAVMYRWKDKRDELEHVGYIAQEVEKVAPEMVGEVDGFKTLDYIQVLIAKVERLEKENDELRARLDRLEARFLDDGR